MDAHHVHSHVMLEILHQRFDLLEVQLFEEVAALHLSAEAVGTGTVHDVGGLEVGEHDFTF